MENLGNLTLCWNKLMECWLQDGMHEYPATWEGLYILLEDANFPAVAEKLRKAVSPAIRVATQVCADLPLVGCVVQASAATSTTVTSSSLSDSRLADKSLLFWSLLGVIIAMCFYVLFQEFIS